MAHRDALVPSARDRLVARQSARDLLHVTRHGLPEFVLTVAPSPSEHAARCARKLAMAIVQHLVVTGMLARARPVASGPPRTARYRRVDYLGAALAVQFVEAALQTR